MAEKVVRLTLEDGKTVNVTLDVGEGVTDEQIKQYVMSLSSEKLADMVSNASNYQSNSEIPKYEELGLPVEPKASQDDYSLKDNVIGAGEAGLNLATGMTTGAIGYTKGILDQLYKEISEGKIGTQESAARVQEAAMKLAQIGTYEPRTEQGQEYTQDVAELSANLIPVAPHLMTAQTAPLQAKTAVPKGQRLSSNPAKAIAQASPQRGQIKSLRDNLYADLETMGVRVKPEAYNEFVARVGRELEKKGMDKDLTPQSYTVYQRLVEGMDKAKSLQEIDQLRRKAQIAASSLEKPDAMLGGLIVEAIDTAIDGAAKTIGGKYKKARDLHGRIRRSEDFESMIQNAEHTASGLENGLRIEARKLLKNKKRLKFYTKDEIAALRQIEKGTTAANIAKFFGKFGISEGQATSMLGAAISSGGGATVGSLIGGAAGAGIGAVTLPLLGQISKKAAQRITLKNTRYAEALTRAGKDGLAIAKAYLRHTPKNKRNVSDLTQLLLGSDVKALESLMRNKDSGKIVADAKFFAEQINKEAQNAGAAAAIAGIEGI